VGGPQPNIHNCIGCRPRTSLHSAVNFARLKLRSERIPGNSWDRGRPRLLHGWGGHCWSIHFNEDRREVRYGGSPDLAHSLDLIALPVTFAGASLFILFGFIYTYEFFADVSAAPVPEN